VNRFYKNFVADVIIAAVLTVLGIIMIPPIGIGTVVLDLFVCIALIAYLILFRFDKLRRSRGTIFILTSVEFTLVALIAIWLILKQFGILNIGGICPTVGVIMWLRGVTDAVSHYMVVTGAKRGRRNVIQFSVDLGLISLGMVMISRNLVSDLVLNWIICVAMILAGLMFAALAVLFHPGKKKE
jgi:hypothetical protein